jgi:hypothetical protein
MRPSRRLRAPAYCLSAALFASEVNFLAWKMARSERWHKIRWLPQVTSMAGNWAGSTRRARIERRDDFAQRESLICEDCDGD